MRSSFGPEKFLMASKKPRIRELVEKVSSMSIDEIEKLDEKPDVIKGLLNIKKQYNDIDALARAEKIADMMTAAYLKRISS